MSNGVLKCRFEDEKGKAVMFQWVVPKQQRKEILHHLHGGPMGAHLGESKTLQKLKGSTGQDTLLMFRSGVALVNPVHKERCLIRSHELP